MFAFFPYMPFGTAPAGVPCQPMPSVSFFSYPTQPTPIFMHPSPAGMLPSPSSSPPSAPSPFLLYPSQPMPCIMPPGAPVLFSASPPSVLPSPNLSSSPPSTTTCCSRRLPYLQPSPSPSTSPSTSPRSSSTSETAATKTTTTTTTTAPIPIPKATAGPRGGSHGINCTCKSNGGGGSSGGRNPSTAELSLTVLATTPRKEQRDPAYAEKLERYRNKMRRTAPMADPQRSLQASKRKRDAMGKFIKGEEVGRRTSARVDEIKIEAEAASGPPPPSAEQVRQHEEQHRRADAEDRAGDAKNEEEERKRREEENFSPRTRVNFLLN